MVNRNLIRGLDLKQEEWEEELAAAMGGAATGEIDWGGQNLSVNQILIGKVLRVLSHLGVRLQTGVAPWRTPKAAARGPESASLSDILAAHSDAGSRRGRGKK